MFGRRLDERLGKWHFWLMFAGFNLAFMPQHFLGLLGMPRRISTYSEGGAWEIYNRISTIGAFLMGVAILVFAINAFRSRNYRRVGNDPWVANTLEWFATSPPPPENWTAPLPYVSSPRPLRDLRIQLEETRRG
jgi:heme/copper-type cytochrome/quinol oxidase subunit 1